MAEERLQKVLAQAGLGSRRACEELIQAGRVTVDGRVVTELGGRVDPALADIRVDGRPIAAEQHRYIILNKPAGYLSGPDPRAEYPSWEALVKVPERLYAVGRLDQDSEGLLLLTNDGDLAVRLTHPRYEHAKTYLVQVEGFPNPRKIRRLQHGVMLEDGRTLPARVVLWRELPADVGRGVLATVRKRPARPSLTDAKARAADGRVVPTSWLKVTLREGRKRQLRRMVALLGHPARRVIRIGLGPLVLGDLRPGKWRDLMPGELKALREAAGHIPVPGADSLGTERKHRAVIPNTIAIDGPSASGKSTIGGLWAAELGYLYFDTGVMYRAVAAAALARGVPIGDEAAVTALSEQACIEVLPATVADGRDVTVLVDGMDVSWDIRRPEVEKAVSPVSAYPGVREAMRVQQRRIGERGRVVMVGRDIGTVVLPDAELKIYLDASLAERARRRYLQREARGEHVEFDRVMQDVRRRDEYDSTRQHAPLAAAPDAIVVDTTGLSVDQVIERVRVLLKQPARPATASREA
jgi:cytidylate kinase